MGSPRNNLIRRDLCCPHFGLRTSQSLLTSAEEQAAACLKRSAVTNLHSVWRLPFISAATNRVLFEGLCARSEVVAAFKRSQDRGRTFKIRNRRSRSDHIFAELGLPQQVVMGRKGRRNILSD